MICSKCGWSSKIANGNFKNTPWEETPCARCRLVENGTGVMEYDDEMQVNEEVCKVGTPDAEDPLLPASVLADALRLFLSLPRDALDVLHLRFGGMPYREIAAKLGVGTAAVEVRHKRMIENIPALRELFPAKTRKRVARGRRKGKAIGDE